MDREKFILVAKNKAIIKQLQAEVDENENELRKTFASDVKQFFLSKGFEFKHIEDKYRNPDYENVFINLRQIDDKSTFTSYRGEPKYYIAGKNNLIVRFEWSLKKNSGNSQIYWYPEKQTLDDFFERRLKKTLILPIKIERKNKLSKLEGLSEI